MPIPTQKTKNSASQHLASGALSGFAAAVLLQPLDLLKTRLQQSSQASPSTRNALFIARQIVSNHGPSGLWRGTIPTLSRNVPGVALYFYSLQSIRNRMSTIPFFATGPGTESTTSALAKLSSQGNLMSGAVARLGVGFILNPFSVVKARFESSNYAYRSMGDAFSSIIRASGPLGLLQGFQASALRDAPYAGLFVLFYELIKDKSTLLLVPYLGLSPAMVHSWSGASASIIATLITHPFDVMKTRMQVQSDDSKYRSLRSTAAGVMRERGIRGFFDGSNIRMGRKVLSSAISWTVYEMLLLAMQAT